MQKKIAFFPVCILLFVMLIAQEPQESKIAEKEVIPANSATSLSDLPHFSAIGEGKIEDSLHRGQARIMAKRAAQIIAAKNLQQLIFQIVPEAKEHAHNAVLLAGIQYKELETTSDKVVMEATLSLAELMRNYFQMMSQISDIELEQEIAKKYEEKLKNELAKNSQENIEQEALIKLEEEYAQKYAIKLQEEVARIEKESFAKHEAKLKEEIAKLEQLKSEEILRLQDIQQKYENKFRDVANQEQVQMDTQIRQEYEAKLQEALAQEKIQLEYEMQQRYDAQLKEATEKIQKEPFSKGKNGQEIKKLRNLIEYLKREIQSLREKNRALEAELEEIYSYFYGED